MAITLISRTNTIDEWRVQTNQSATSLNNIETGDYSKSNGVLSISANGSLSITANGTALQVSNSALFQSNVTIGGDIGLGSQGSATGNLTSGGIVTVLAPGNALQVANNATVNTDLQVTRTIYTGNVSANGNLTVGGNETVSGILRLPGSGNVLYVNSGVAVVNTISATDIATTNADIDLATIAAETVTTSTISVGTILLGNVVSLTSNSATVSYSTIGNTSITKADIATANITSTLNVQSALVKVRGTSASNDALLVELGKTTVQDVVIQGNLVVSGTYTQTGNTNLEVDTFTLNANTGVNKDAIFVNSRPSGNSAVIRWVESDKSWKVSKGNTYSSLNNILDASYVDTTVTNSSTTQVASASAVKLAYDTAVIVGGYANSAYTSQNTTGVYANTAHLHANAAYVSQNTTGVYANTAYLHANASYLSQNTTGVYANTGYTHANAAFSFANTASQRAITSGDYANSAYSHANTRFASAGGTITGAVVIQGNLTVTGTQSYVNTTNMLFADAILTLNSDWPTTSSPTENAGIEVQRGTAANTVLRWNETTDKWEFTNDGSFYGDIAGVYQVQAAGSYANSAYGQSNTATTNAATADQRAVTSGSYANGAFGRANTATTNAATADQRAVTSGVYANSAYAQANTATTNAATAQSTANAKVTKAGDTMTGALVVESTITATGTITAPLFSGTATSARYADLAELYLADKEYPVGTVMMVGGENEVTAANPLFAKSVIGVVSDKPAYLMNDQLTGGTAIALKGRVPVRVIGTVVKGDPIGVGAEGLGSVNYNDRFGVALQDKNDDVEGIIEVVIL
jgi:hypothetical protein